MEKLKMHTPDLAEENYKKLAALFPDAVTETIDDEGKVVRAIDKDVLMQEINAQVVDDGQERYQFTWPDKRKAVVLANQPIAKTLRFEQEKSVGRDGTPGGTDSENIYIEGDNLDALKLLQETYLGKVKMIYIDPPYNTGNDFIYEDDFSQKADDYADNSGQTDEEGNRLVQNSESNGRFHTDWLNMIYPRLRLAKDLLSEDGVIFISIDDNEQENLKKICDEIFGQNNFVCDFVRKNKAGSGHDSCSIAIEFDYILCYTKNMSTILLNQEPIDIENDPKYKLSDKYVKTRGKYYLRDLDYRGSYSETGDYPITTPDGTIIYSGGQFGRPNTWRWSKTKFLWGLKNDFIVFKKNSDNDWKVYIKQYQYVDNNGNSYIRTIPYRALIDFNNGLGSIECGELLGSNVFSYPKPSELIKHLLKIGSQKDSIILDFFSGSATTAHAVMKLNAEDGGNRKFILVQLPEKTAEKSEAYKAGYNTICDIGEERIRRAGKKIKEETGADIDYGFRCFKVDSSNMKDVYYSPAELGQIEMDQLTDNIKEDRTPEDLLIQVMLDLGILLSSKVEQTEIAGKKVFSVADGYLIACFDKNVTNEVVTAIAKRHPFYAVFRDSSMADDSVAANFEQIFETYSPQTVRKVL